jgi:hypothetical protein
VLLSLIAGRAMMDFFAVPVIMLTYALGTSLLDPIFERARANVKPITAVHFVPPKTSFPFFFS